jgi:two-component system chemotaxis response regulator CheB
MNALHAGALTVLEKPVGTTSADYEALAERLCTQLAIMSQVKVVRRRAAVVFNQHPTSKIQHPSIGGYRMLGIVTSTGGPSALVQILSMLGSDFPVPILVVQHITGSFLEGFASWLESACPFSVVLVRDRVVPAPGTVYLATQDRHLRMDWGALRVDGGDPVSAQRPSGTVLFESMAKTLGSGALGVLLTGMGEDGAMGLLQLRKAGGHTIAEHESTAVVYGMPAEAVRLGAVCESLPLPAIAPRILELTLSKREVA